jgi:histidinol-phosphatase (PHP family)
LDLDFVEPVNVDFDRYFSVLEMMRDKYSGQIDIRSGVEFGLQSHLGNACKELVDSYAFDFVIGSIHMVDGYDPWYPEYFQQVNDMDGYRRAFELTLEGIRAVEDIDVLGHLDYIVRCGSKRAEEYSYARFAELIDEILKYLISQGKGLELNTAGWKYQLGFAHPHQDVLKRYKELGGEIITIGSDAHSPKDIAYGFENVKAYLEACGFKYYTEFKRRKPVFCAL